MFFVGIDVACDKHNCCIISDDGEIVSEFVFFNSRKGFEFLLDKFRCFASPDEIHIGLEATGIYGNNLGHFLSDNGYVFTTLNPLAVKKQISATSLRKTKTDKSDARSLALLMLNGSFKPDTSVLYHISELKSLSRARNRTVSDCSKAKIRAKALITELFPEFKAFFSDTFGTSALAVLSKYPSAKDIANCNIRSLSALLSKASRGRFGLDKARQLKELAKNSIGYYSEAKVISLKFELQEIELRTAQISEYDRLIKNIMDEINSPILSVPGIGYTLGASILSEIGDISLFSSPAKLLAFAGLEPSINDSGKHIGSSGSMVKRGSPFLRFSLIQAAKSIALYDPTFSAYLNKKISEGKHYSVAVSHTAKKLVRVIFYLLSSNRFFVNLAA